MKTVIEMALNSGDDEWKILVRQVMKHFPDEFERFAELVRADERARMAEQPAQQEPVALEDVYLTIIQWDVGGGKRSRRELARRIVAKYTPPAQRTWVGLTDEEIEQSCVPLGAAMLSFTEVARAIEAKLRSKNEDRN